MSGNTIPDETIRDFGGDEFRASVFYYRYALRDRDGTRLETRPQQMWLRIAREIASVETDRGKRREAESRFKDILWDFRFIPGGRIMFGAGSLVNATLSNCYVLPVDDSIESIMETAKMAALTYSRGGGVGIDLSPLRPNGAYISNTGLTSSGSVSFGELYSFVTGLIGQGGRRGALMLTIDCTHPDVLDFIRVKSSDVSKINYANMSVKVTDLFMNRAIEGGDIQLVYDRPHYIEKYGKPYTVSVNASMILDELAGCAWRIGDPAPLFWDTIVNYSTTLYLPELYGDEYRLIATNPCGEIPLEAYNNCTLSNINLSVHVKHQFTSSASIDFDKLKETVRYGVRFLDNVVTYNLDRHPLKEQSIHSFNTRRIGLGVTGLADMLVKLNIRYDSGEALDCINQVFKAIRDTAYETSVMLAKEKGKAPYVDSVRHVKQPFIERMSDDIRRDIREYGIRNIALLTIPPVGTGSALAGVSSGIEPFYAFKQRRRVRGMHKQEFTPRYVTVDEYRDRFGVELPSFFVSAYEIDPYRRVDIQATAQYYIDQSISSTVNLPSSVTPMQIRELFIYAWRQGCKGITIYRDKSRSEQILSKDSD